MCVCMQMNVCMCVCMQMNVCMYANTDAAGEKTHGVDRQALTRVTYRMSGMLVFVGLF
jgi:hypothetical protein